MDPRVPQGDQFNLKWSNHTKNFVDIFAHYQNQENLVDVTLSCEGQYVKAHRLVLSACSDYFQSIFQVHKTVQHPFILLNNIHFRDLKCILNFIYYGEVKVLESDLPSVLALGSSLQIKGLSAVKLRHPEDIPNPTMNNLQPTQEVVPPEHGIHSNMVDSKKIFFNGNAYSVAPQDAKLVGSHFENSKLELARENFKVKLPNFIVPNKPVAGQTKTEVFGKEDSETKEPSNETVSPKQNNTFDGIEPPLKKRLVLSAHGLFEKLKSEKGTFNTSSSINVPTTKESTKIGNNSSECSGSSSSSKNKIPRPPNAFMIFANEFRTNLAGDFPDDNNKEISKRLGILWKTLPPEAKEKYYEAASKADREHKLKYPDYQYNPNEARKRKSTLHKSQDGTSSGSTGNIDTSDEVDPLSVVEVEEDSINLCLSESD